MVWFHLRRRGWTHGGCGFTLLSVRLWGLALWALVAGLTLVVVPSTKYILAGIPTWMSAWPLWIGGGCATVVICAIAPHWLARKERIDLKPIGWADPLLHLVLALLSALVNGGSIWIAAKATGVPFSLAACMGLLAWFNFAMALPVSLGGLGLQEALVLRLGMPMGIPASTLLAFSGIVHLTRVVLALSGGLLSILRSSSDRQVFPPVDANEGLP